MAGTSYASVAAAPAVSPTGQTNGHEVLSHQRQDLYVPAPTSMTLIASLMLIDASPQPEEVSVYLMTQSYLHNWLNWAYHQSVPPDEASRVNRAIKMAIEKYRLQLSAEFRDPGPIDATSLSVMGHALLLRPNVEIAIHDETVPTLEPPIKLKKTQSLSAPPNKPKAPSESMVACCAVPERFYELLRSVHGVVCEDGLSLSFQPELEKGVIIHHHSKLPHPSHPRPVEFRRKIVLVPASSQSPESLSPMSKLIQGEGGCTWVSQVEVHPVKFSYTVAAGDSRGMLNEDNVGDSGFLLISQSTLMVDAIQAIRLEVAPNYSSSCVRIWSRMSTLRKNGKEHATVDGDGYELVRQEYFDAKSLKPGEKPGASTITVGQWSSHLKRKRNLETVEILVETRVNSKTKWARQSLELDNRLQVGDFVDAQDTAGNWYEAIVRKITEDTITVHYMGWASRWDAEIRRRRIDEKTEGVAKNVNPPAPLWSQTSRWRESIEIGHKVEIREAASLILKPKWYRGIVRAVGNEDDQVRETIGGAELEALEIDPSQKNGKRRPLLLLNRTRQVLVEVPQEDSAIILYTSQPSKSPSGLPPNHRWVNLYGEEICRVGTHLKVEQDSRRPATVCYDFDARRPPVEVMKSFNNMHGAGFVRESLRGVPPAPGSVGLHNLGNSCFLNSIVQCLNHIEPLTQYFLKGAYLNDLNTKNPLGSRGTVATTYAYLLNEMWSGDYSTLAPRLLKKTVANFAPQFNNVYQHDSHEFCSFLMDGLHEDLNRVRSKPYVEELEGFGMQDKKAAIQSWRNHLLRHDSIIVDHCQGMHRSHLTCPLCGRESIKFDVFSSISLPVGGEKNHGSVPLSHCLERFTEGEQLDEHNAWYCPTCEKHVCALKMIALWSVPDILILHLKRFTFDTSGHGGGVVRHKIEDTITFPIERLDMSPYILGPVDEDAPPIYKLFGVSEHSGSTASSGHYTATVRNSKDGKWYRYNDSHVGSSSGEASITGGAYLLFYQRRKGTARWAGMENELNRKDVDSPTRALEKDKDGFTPVTSKKKKKGKI